MATICIFCGGNCGRVCRRFKSSDGVRESRPDSTAKSVVAPQRTASVVAKIEALGAGVAPGPSDAKAKIPAIDRAKAVTGNAQAVRHSVGGEAKPKLGRPRIGEVRAKPWLTADPPMSERTWYRRQEEKRAKEEGNR
jgi:hypothetical protein